MTTGASAAYKARQAREDEGEKLLLDHVCGSCGSKLVMPYDSDIGERVVKCGKDRSHQGFVKQKSLFRLWKEGVGMPLEVAQKFVDMEEKQKQKEAETMVTELGPENAQALVQYQGVTSLTKDQAREILTTVWPKAPQVEVFRAAILCQSYGLNPLMGHVFLVPFKDNWATIMGIKAKRLISSRRGPVDYIDGPRAMTEQEQIVAFGEPDPARLWVVTRLRDPKSGTISIGYGNWLKTEPVYGAEKGNSKFNMAAIRSESQALDRLRPGEMPQGVAVADEQYIKGEAQQIVEAPTAPGGPPAGPGVVEAAARPTVTASGQGAATDAAPGADPGADQPATAGDISEMGTALMNVKKWNSVTARAFMEHSTGKADCWTKSDLARVRKAAGL